MGSDYCLVAPKKVKYVVGPHRYGKKYYLLRPSKWLAQLVGSFSSCFGLGSLDQKMFSKTVEFLKNQVVLISYAGIRRSTTAMA